MEVLVLGLRVLLAAVFIVAAVAKLRDLPGSRRALEEFGVPARLIRPGGLALPLAELAIAAGLLFPASARWAGFAAAALLVAFVIAIAHAIANDRAPDCHCFGHLHSEPAGSDTLVRNAILIAVAGAVAAFGPGPAIHSWLGDRSGLELAMLALAVVAIVALSAGAVRSSRRRNQDRRERSGLPIGSPAPDFTLPAGDDDQRTLESLCARGLPAVLVFVQPQCGPCQVLLPSLSEWRSRLATRLTITVVSEEDGEIYHAYELRHGTPAAVVVDPDRTIASLSVAGNLAIEELIRATLRRIDADGHSTDVAA